MINLHHNLTKELKASIDEYDKKLTNDAAATKTYLDSNFNTRKTETVTALTNLITDKFGKDENSGLKKKVKALEDKINPAKEKAESALARANSSQTTITGTQAKMNDALGIAGQALAKSKSAETESTTASTHADGATEVAARLSGTTTNIVGKAQNAKDVARSARNIAFEARVKANYSLNTAKRIANCHINIGWNMQDLDHPRAGHILSKKLFNDSEKAVIQLLPHYGYLGYWDSFFFWTDGC